MFKKFFALFLIGLLAFTATGCSIFGDDDNDVAAAAGTVVKTKITKPDVGAGNILGDLRAGIRAETTTTSVVGAVVTLKLSDGREIKMTDNGNGEYTATVTGLDGAKGFIIEARKGDLLVQSMVTDLKGDLTNLEANHLTTAFTQVALSAAQAIGTNTGIAVTSLSDLIANVTSISIDYTELKRQVTDETNVLYESSRKIVTVALENANEDAEGTVVGASLLEKLIAGTYTDVSEGALDALSEATGVDFTTETITNIWEEQVTTPMEGQIPTEAPVADADLIDKAVETYLNAFLKITSNSILTAAEMASFSAVLDEDFVMNGMKKINILAVQTSDKNDLDHFDGKHVLSKIDDNTYLVHVIGTAYLVGDKTITIDSTVDGYYYDAKAATIFKASSLQTKISQFPVIIRRQKDSSWKVWGNRVKIDEVNLNLNYGIDLNQTTPSQFTNLWIQIRDTLAFPVKSVSLSGGAIGATSIALAKDAQLADANTWHYWYQDPNNTANKNVANYPVPSWPYSATQHQKGQEYKFVVTFADNTTQTFIHQVPTIPAGYAPFSSTAVSVVQENNMMKITWPKNAFPTMFENYYINVWNMTDGGDGRVLERQIADINTTSAEFVIGGTSYQLLPGKQYSINFNSDINSGLAQHFYKSFTVEDPSILAAVAITKVLDAGAQMVAQGAAGIPVPTFGAAPVSMRAVTVATAMDFPAETEFFTSYTGYDAMSDLTNIFSIPASFAGIVHQLLRLKDMTGKELSYTDAAPYLDGVPSNMDMLVVFEDTTAGIKMQLGLENYTVLTNNNDYVLPFEAVGTVTVQVGTDNFEVRVTGAMVDVAKRGADVTPVANGMNLEGKLYKNGAPFMINDLAATFRYGTFTAEGLNSGYIFAGDKVIATLARPDNVLTLYTMTENGTSTIMIQ
ncbi:MAG: hypothetical protein KKB51_22245 [Candidatus Riflebacteria bacterium]|nr:hypothetical protein [Candidatus Riflebacteria bacterium]